MNERLGLEEEIEWLKERAETSSKGVKKAINIQIEDMKRELKKYE